MFLSAFPYQTDVLALPVANLDVAANWYAAHFGLAEVSRGANQVVLQRNGVEIGFAIDGNDPEQDGAAILVDDIDAIHQELTTAGAAPGPIKVADHDGKPLRAFFVIAPDGLCYYFHQPITGSEPKADT